MRSNEKAESITGSTTYAGIWTSSGKSCAFARLRLAKPGTFLVTVAAVKVLPPSPETSQLYGLGKNTMSVQTEEAQRHANVCTKDAYPAPSWLT